MFYFLKRTLQFSTFLTCSAIICGTSVASSLVDKTQDFKRRSSATLRDRFYKVDPGKKTWSLDVVSQVNPFFSRPYTEATNPNDSFSKLQDPQDPSKVVYRPNHSLAHGIRQAYLAVDVATFLGNLKEADTQGTPLAPFIGWVKGKLKTDPDFLKKVEFANAFQRTGRQSEASRKGNKAAYERYLQADQENFLARLNQRAKKLFHTPAEIKLFQGAITKKYAPDDLERLPVEEIDLFYLSRIFYSAHLLDLRRLPHFSKDQVHKEVSAALFGHTTLDRLEKKLLRRLWDRAGAYLKATGDRDMEGAPTWNAPLFIRQAHNPAEMIEALQLARTAPEATLIDALLKHTHVMREIKEKGETQLSQRDALKDVSDLDATPSKSLAQQLQSAPYTASESYLKILLKEAYQEIPLNSSVKEVRRLTRANVRAFLAAPQPTEHDGQQLKNPLIPRLENPDESYVEQLVACLLEERKNRNAVVMYHTTEPEIGFLFDLYTQMRNQLMMMGGEAKKDLRALRVIDDAFLLLSRRLYPDNLQAKATIKDFMKTYPAVLDDNPTYREMILSANFSLFGSDQQLNADTYTMFHKVRDQKVVSQGVGNVKKGERGSDLSSFFDYIEGKTNIAFDRKALEKMQKKYFDEQGNGRLIQLFINPEAARDMTYLSVLMGVPVLQKKAASGASENPDFLETVLALRNAPATFSDHMQGMTGQHLPGNEGLSRPGQLQLHNLQARLLMRPDLMLDPTQVQIKSYWRLGKPSSAYDKSLQKIVDQGLKTWIQGGMQGANDVFESQTNRLPAFVDAVFEGQTGSKKGVSKIPTVEEKVVQYFREGKKGLLIEEIKNHWDSLRSQTFTFPALTQRDRPQTLSFAEILVGTKSPELLKLAFDRGLFPGGEKVHAFYNQHVKQGKKAFLLETLPSILFPQMAAEVFERFTEARPLFLEKKEIKTFDKVAIFKGIGDPYTLPLLIKAFDACTNDSLYKDFCDAFAQVEDLETATQVRNFLSQAPGVLDKVVTKGDLPQNFLETQRLIQGKTLEEKTHLQDEISTIYKNHPRLAQDYSVPLLRLLRSDQRSFLDPLFAENEDTLETQESTRKLMNTLQILKAFETTPEEPNSLWPVIFKVFEGTPLWQVDSDQYESLKEYLSTYKEGALKQFEKNLKGAGAEDFRKFLRQEAANA